MRISRLPSYKLCDSPIAYWSFVVMQNIQIWNERGQFVFFQRTRTGCRQHAARFPPHTQFADEQTARFQRGNYLWEKTTVQVIEEQDQIKSFRFKFVLGGIPYKKIEIDVMFKSGLTELSNRHIGNIYNRNLPIPTGQPEGMPSNSTP